MKEQSSTGRSAITKAADSLLIEIPAQRSWLVVGFLAFWLAFWVLGESLAIMTLFSNSSDNSGGWLVVIVWGIFWTIGGLYALVALLWQVVGKEKILVTPNTLSIGKYIFNLNRSKQYNIAQIKKLQTNPLPTDDIFAMNQRHNIVGLKGGTLQFQYGKKTIKFAGSISDAEARRILEELRSCQHLHEQHFADYQLVPGI